MIIQRKNYFSISFFLLFLHKKVFKQIIITDKNKLIACGPLLFVHVYCSCPDWEHWSFVVWSCLLQLS